MSITTAIHVTGRQFRFSRQILFISIAFLSAVSCGPKGDGDKPKNANSKSGKELAKIFGKVGELDVPSREEAQKKQIPTHVNEELKLNKITIYAFSRKDKDLPSFEGMMFHDLKNKGKLSSDDEIQVKTLDFNQGGGNKGVQVPIEINLSETVAIKSGQVEFLNPMLFKTNVNSGSHVNWSVNRTTGEEDTVFVTDKVIRNENEFGQGTFRYRHLDKVNLEVRLSYSDTKELEIWGIRDAFGVKLVFVLNYVAVTQL